MSGGEPIVTMMTNAASAGVEYGLIWSRLGAVPVVALIVLLIERELLVAYGGSRLAAVARILDVGIIPLLVASVLILAVRFARILGLV
jgi:hypothetical protein